LLVKGHSNQAGDGDRDIAAASRCWGKDYIINALQSQLRQEALPPDAAIAYLKQILRDMLNGPLQQTSTPTFAPETLNIWLITGVNGAGKPLPSVKLPTLLKNLATNA